MGANREPMLDMFIYETNHLIEQLEQIVISSEKSNGLEGSINEIFRIMHTIKGSAAMMLFSDIALLAHVLEDLFAYIRQYNPDNIDQSVLTDLVLQGVDFIKQELTKIDTGNDPDGNSSQLVQSIKEFLSELMSPQIIQANSQDEVKVEEKQNQGKFYINSAKVTSDALHYKAVVFFEDDCEMENIRAYTVAEDLKDIAFEIDVFPSDITENDVSIPIIRNDGFVLNFSTDRDFEQVRAFLMRTAFLKELKLEQVEEKNIINLDVPQEQNSQSNQSIPVVNTEPREEKKPQEAQAQKQANGTSNGSKQSIISVDVKKLDKLLDLVGELVISEAMVTRNPELEGMVLESFHKASRQLRKITNELQDIVMSIRMVPLAMTFQKMQRIVRDMSHKLEKEIELKIIGEETEVDKNIIERISDPLMHLIRNAIDHGIEKPEDRVKKGKQLLATVTLEAKNAGSDVWITVNDNGRGLDKETIIRKAKENGLLKKPEEEMSDKEIYGLIFLPGFSTKEKVSEFSGRGVGMDVVMKNIQDVGGTVMVDSAQNVGTTISIKIPLTLAIIDGMTIKVGDSRYTLPMTSIKESFRVKEREVILDPDGNEMIMVRGQCYPVIRLHEAYGVKDATTEIDQGIIIMVENDTKIICLFADALLGEQQVVVKSLPRYLKKVQGLAGCTLLGDGSISLILDVAALINR